MIILFFHNIFEYGFCPVLNQNNKCMVRRILKTINYLQNDPTDEDHLVAGLVSIASSFGRGNRDITTLNNDLVHTHFEIKARCTRENSHIESYRKATQSLLIKFSYAYFDVCESNDLLDKKLQDQFTIRDLFGAISQYQSVVDQMARPSDQVALHPLSKDQTRKATHTTYSSSIISIDMILEGARLHFEQAKEKYGTGRWPSCKDFTTITYGPLKGESFGTIDKHLRDGGRGLPGGSSLYQLLEEHGLGPKITEDDILDAAKFHFFQVKADMGQGKWPSSSDKTEITSGPLEGKTWKGIDTALRRGYFGLPSGTTLSKFLKAHGCHNMLDPRDVVQAAQLHFEETKRKTGRGKWPSSKDNNMIKSGPLKGEKWSSVHTAIRDGYRGFEPIDGGLPTFLKAHDCYDRPLVKQDVIISALIYKSRHPENKWPNNKVKEQIGDDTLLHGMRWSAVDKRKIGGMSLRQIIDEYDAYPALYKDAEDYVSGLMAQEDVMIDNQSFFQSSSVDLPELSLQ